MPGTVDIQKPLAKSLAEQQEILVDGLREFVREQKPLWNQLPNLMLEADGRSGYDDNHARAYYSHIYPISENRHGYDVCIDLETGELIYHPTEYSPERIIASNQRITSLAAELDALNAQKYIDSLRNELTKEYWGGYNPRKIAQWRADIRAADPFLQATLSPEFSLDSQSQRLREAILIIEKTAGSQDSELRSDQVRNAVGHVLYATDFDDREDGADAYSPVDNNVKAAREIIRGAGIYVGLRSPQFGPLFSDLSEVAWHNAVAATAKVRNERGMIHPQDPENELIYKELGKDATRRANGNAYMFASPLPTDITADSKVGTGFYTAGEIADWLLNTKPAKLSA